MMEDESINRHRLQQAVTGSVNEHTNAVSVGLAPDGQRITVYGTGSNVVVLDEHLKRVQILKREGSGDVVAVATCAADGKFAVMYEADCIVLYTPVKGPTTAEAAAATESAGGRRKKHRKDAGFPWSWSELEKLPVMGGGRCMSWGPLGQRLVVGGSKITMWRLKSQVASSPAEPSMGFGSVWGLDMDVSETATYVPVFSRTMATTIEHLAFSPDGTMFASLGKRDQLIKVWYPRPPEFSGFFRMMEQFDFIYLAHPRPVTALSWRRTSDPLSLDGDRFVCNILLTSCEDNVCRLWSETPVDEPLKFYVCGVINPQDYSALKMIPTQAFVLHWLNSHELHRNITDARHSEQNKARRSHHNTHIWATGEFVAGEAAWLEAQARTSSTAVLEGVDEDGAADSVATDTAATADAAAAPAAESGSTESGSLGGSIDLEGGSGSGATSDNEEATGRPRASTSRHTPSALSSSNTLYTRRLASSATPHNPDETWPDMVFFVHPDGSIIFWSIRMLDVYPRRLPRVQLASWTVPGLIPPAVAGNLSNEVVVYPSSVVSDWWYGRTAQSATAKKLSRAFKYTIQRPLPLTLVMRHAGSLSEWNVTFVEKSSLSAVSRVEAVAWCSGHRFPVATMCAHPLRGLALSVGQDAAESGTSEAEAVLWTSNATSGLPLHNKDTLSQVAKHIITGGSSASPAVAAWVPSHSAAVALVSTGNGIRVLVAGHRASSPADPSKITSIPELVESIVLPNSSGSYLGLYVHPADVGNDAESFWVIALTKGSPGDPPYLSAWRITVIGTKVPSAARDLAKSPADSPMVLRKEPKTVLEIPGSNDSNASPPSNTSSNSNANVGTAVGPLANVVPTVLARSLVRAHSLDVRGDPLPTCASLINGVQPGCTAPFMLTNEAILTVGFADGVVRSWHCMFEPAPIETLQSGYGMHANGGIDFARIETLDEVLSDGFGSRGNPTHLSATYDGNMAVAMQDPTGGATSSSVLALYDVAKTGEKLGFSMRINLDGPVLSLAWGSGSGGLKMLFVGMVGQVLTYSQQSNDRDASVDQFALIARTPIPRSEDEYQGGPASMCVLQSGDLAVSQNAELFMFGMWLTPQESNSALPLGDARRNRASLFSSSSSSSSLSSMNNRVGNSGSEAVPNVAVGAAEFNTAANIIEESNQTLPFYHADQLSALLLSGRKARVKRIIELMGEYVGAIEEDAARSGSGIDGPATQFSVSLSDIMSADEDAATKKAGEGKQKKAGADYGDLFSGIVGDHDGMSGGRMSGFAKDAKRLCERAQRVQLDRLSRKEQVLTLAMIESVADTEANEDALDECGMRYFVPVKMNAYLSKILPPAQRPTGLPTYYYAWALLSETQEQLLEFCPSVANADRAFQWEDLRALGAGYWIKNPALLRKYAEKLAKNAFAKDNQPLDAAVWYLAMKKKSLLHALFRSKGDQRMSGFFSNDFTQERWKTAALKNAFALLGKQRFSEAVGFFLLGGEIEDAVSTCIRKLGDLQMAVVICRLFEGDDSPTLGRLLQKELIEKAAEGPFLASIAHWMKKDYTSALDVLLKFDSDTGGSGGSDAGSAEGTNDSGQVELGSVAAALNLSRYLREHILLRGSVSGVSTAAAVPRRLYIKAYHSYVARGMLLLALDTLVDMQQETPEDADDDEEGSDEDDDAPHVPAQPADPFAFNMASFGAPAPAPAPSQTPESAKKKKKKKKKKVAPVKKAAPAADPFAFNMGAFNMGPPAAVEDEDEASDDSSDEDNTIVSKRSGANKALIRTWQFACSIRLIAEYLIFWRSKEANWQKFPEQVKQEVSSMIRFCNRDNAKATAADSTTSSKKGGSLLTSGHASGGGSASSSADPFAFNMASFGAAAPAPSPPPPTKETASFSSRSESESAAAAATKLDVLMVQNVLLATNRLREAPEIKCAIFLEVSRSQMLPFCRNMCAELCSFILTFAVPGLHPEGMALPARATKARVRTLAAGLANCLQVMSAFPLPSSCRPSAFELCEYVGAIYASLYVVAWLERDLKAVLQVLTNKPEASMWGTTLSPGCDDATDVANAMAQFARKDPIATRRQNALHDRPVPSVLDFIETDVSDEEYRAVDETAPLDDDGNLGEAIPEAGSDDAAAKAYRWALLELVASHRFIEQMRILGNGAGIDLSDQSEGPVFYTQIMSSLEHKAATLQSDLDALPVPPEMEETESILSPRSKMRSASADAPETPVHLVRGLFKIRTLFEAQNNRFGTVPSRRLWQFVLKKDRSQPTIEYYMFGRAGEDASGAMGGGVSSGTGSSRGGGRGNSAVPPASSSVGKVEVAFQSSHAELRSICLNACNQDSMVVGTAKGLSELWLNRRDLLEDDLDDDAEFGSGIAGVEGTNGSQPSSSGLVEPSFSPPAGFLSGSRSRSSSPRPGSPVSPMGRFAGTERFATKERFVDTADNDLVGFQRSLASPCRVLASHPSMPCYLSGSADGSVKLWHFDQEQELWSFTHGSGAKVNSIRFEDYGNKLGVANTLGELQLWRFLSGGDNNKPYITIRAHSKHTDDFQFLGSSTVLASGGLSADGNNVAIWDTLTQRASQSMATPVRSFPVCKDVGVRSLAYINSTETLLCGSGKGELSVLDIRQGAIVKTWEGHDGAINKLLVDVEHDSLISGSANGTVKIWSLSSLKEVARFEALHTRSTFFRSGVIDMALDHGNLYTAGADGLVKKIHLWN